MRESSRKGAYAEAGVDIDAQEKGLARIKKLAKSTFIPGVLSEIGSFGGLFRPDLAGMSEPVLVASADGVGTKLAVARMAGDYSSVGRDLVNHCVNDVLVQGAEPLFFLDYVGAGVLEPEKMVELVYGVADGCRWRPCTWRPPTRRRLTRPRWSSRFWAISSLPGSMRRGRRSKGSNRDGSTSPGSIPCAPLRDRVAASALLLSGSFVDDRRIR